MSIRKVLVLRVEDTDDADKHAIHAQWMHIALRKMGYEVDFMIVDENQTNNTDVTTGKSYEFAVIVHPFSYSPLGWLSTLSYGNTLPVFIVNHAEDGSWSTTEIGVNRNQTAGYRLVTFDGIGELPCSCTTHEDTDTSGKEITPLAWETATTTNLVMWKQTSGTYNVYGSAEAGTSAPAESLFPILMQYAINDSAITAPDRKLIATFDLDDMPTDETHTWTAAETRALVDDLVGAGMVTTIGVPASTTIGSRNQLADVWEGNGVNEVIRGAQARNGGPLYPIEHMGSTFWSTVEISSLPLGGQTKGAIDTFYRAHVTNMHNHGIYQGWDSDGLDSYGYHYFNTNRVDDKGLQLATPNTTLLADPLGATAMAGYGWKVARMDSNSRVIGAVGDNTYQGINDYFGIRIIESQSPFADTDVDISLASDPTSYSQQVIQAYLTGSTMLDRATYMHGQNGDDYLNTAIDPPLRVTIALIKLINDFCVNTLRCGHPSEYVR